MFKNFLLIIGDIHADFNKLNQIINKKRPEYVICLGDFGYWPRMVEEVKKNNSLSRRIEKRLVFTKDSIKLNNSKLYFVDGNHEDHFELRKLVENKEPEYNNGPVRVFNDRDIYYCPRGSMLKVEDINFLCIGGAESIDKLSRKVGIDWFEEELPNYSEIDRCLDLVYREKVDIVLSHTCPYEFIPKLVEECGVKVNDPTCRMLSKIREELLKLDQNFYWFYAHWHYYLKDKDKRYTCLNMLGESNSYIVFKTKLDFVKYCSI